MENVEEMYISDLIDRLEEIRQSNGDLLVLNCYREPYTEDDFTFGFMTNKEGETVGTIRL